MVADQDMSVKLDSTMEISPTMEKKCNLVDDKLCEEMMVGPSSSKDCTFDDNGAVDSREEKRVGVSSSKDCAFDDNGEIGLREEMMVGVSNSKDCTFDDNGAVGSPEEMMIGVSNSKDCTIDDNGEIGSREEKMEICRVVPFEGSDEDEEVDIVEDFDPVEDEERRVVERDLKDATESSSSSSFGCTDSETENAAMPGDEEVESLIQEDNAGSLLGFDRFNGLFRMRKKKVSDHWRDFIRPLMWRCRWVELCVRELNSKASKYEKEIAENYERKQNEWEKSAAEDLCMRSTPFLCQNQPKVMKRRKRKRVEETVDLASYTSCHNLFSYHANRKPPTGSSYMDYHRRNADADPAGTDSFDDAFGVNGEFPAFDFNKNDAFEIILWKIEEAQSQVRQLSVRMDKVVTENAGKFTSGIASFGPCDPLASSPNADGGSLFTIPPQTTGKRLYVPESAVYSNGEGTPLPNMTDSIGHFVKCETMEENNGSLTHYQPVKQELSDTTEEIGVQCIGKPLPGIKGKAIQHPNSPSKTMSPREQPSVKGRSIFKPTTPRKRKRGRRKPRTGKWSRRSSGSG